MPRLTDPLQFDGKLEKFTNNDLRMGGVFF